MAADPNPTLDPELDAYFQTRRANMVTRQIQQRGIHNPRLLAVMNRLPRHQFVPRQFWEQAYQDAPVSLGYGVTISQPYIVAAMTDLLNLSGGENVLEIGTGSGYQAAVLAELAATVHTVELQPDLAQRARQVLTALGYQNVFVHNGDGTLGWPPGAPYQAILVTAAAPEIPRPLIDQLGDRGTLVIPVGGCEGQELERWRKRGGEIRREHIFPVAFVPLRGTHGWSRDQWEDKETPQT